jgi:hypothetical protein
MISKAHILASDCSPAMLLCITFTGLRNRPNGLLIFKPPPINFQLVVIARWLEKKGTVKYGG